MNSVTLTRLVRRLLLPAAVVSAVLLWMHFGVMRVPDASLCFTDAYAPGTSCFVAKRPGVLVAGAVVFVATADGVALMRVARCEAELVHLAGPGASAFPDGVPRAAVRGLVLTGVSGSGAASDVPDAPR
ncbi:MAG: hypothetical protein HZB39_03365 [Planctomycetes bacterium]|nr:hypothetical protein [Planctomycetota bacterium]